MIKMTNSNQIFNVHNLEESYWSEMVAPDFSFPHFFDVLVKDLLQKLQQDGPVTAIDVGSGPFGVLTKHPSASKFEITHLDPLLNLYENLTDIPHASISYVKGAAEDIPFLFFDKSFNLVFSRNALDHSQDILRALKGCLSLVSRNGFFFLELLENEGSHAGYTGMHLWNCQRLENDVLLWNPGNYHLVSQIIYEYFGENIWMQTRLVEGSAGSQQQSSVYMWFMNCEPEKSKTSENFTLSYHPLGGLRILSKKEEFYPDLMFLQIRYSSADVQSHTFRWHPEQKIRFFNLKIDDSVSTIIFGETIPDFSKQPTTFVNKWTLRIDT